MFQSIRQTNNYKSQKFIPETIISFLPSWTCRSSAYSTAACCSVNCFASLSRRSISSVSSLKSKQMKEIVFFSMVSNSCCLRCCRSRYVRNAFWMTVAARCSPSICWRWRANSFWRYSNRSCSSRTLTKSLMERRENKKQKAILSRSLPWTDFCR